MRLRLKNESKDRDNARTPGNFKRFTSSSLDIRGVSLAKIATGFGGLHEKLFRHLQYDDLVELHADDADPLAVFLEFDESNVVGWSALRLDSCRSPDVEFEQLWARCSSSACPWILDCYRPSGVV